MSYIDEIKHYEQAKETIIQRIFWTQVSRIPDLPKEFIEKYWDKLIWEELVDYQHLSEEFIEKFIDKIEIDWVEDIWNNDGLHLSEAFIEKHLDKVDWERVSSMCTLSEDFIRKYQDKVNWVNISAQQDLSEDFMREFWDHIDWINVLEFQENLTPDFVRELKNKGVEIKYISSNLHIDDTMVNELKDELLMDEVFGCANLSEGFIRNFKGGKPWFVIIESQRLSEKFLEELIEEYKTIEPKSWTYIFTIILPNQVVSEQFIDKYFDFIKIEDICTNGRQLSEDFIRRHKYALDWKEICNTQKLSEQFTEEMIDFIEWKSLSIKAVENFSEQFIEKYWDKWNLEWLDYSKFSLDFIERHLDEIDKKNLGYNFNWVKKILNYENE